jgi:uncharacterized protein YndB with AHSA1/START domain
MAIEVDISKRIARASVDVMAAIADIDAWPSWLIASGIVTVLRAPAAAGAAPTVGERLTIEQRAAGRAGTFDVQVTAVEPGTRLALEGKDGDGVKIAIDARVAPAEAAPAGDDPAGDDPAATDLEWSFRIDLPFRYRIFEGMAAPQVRHAAALDIEALRLRLESTPKD